MEQRLAALEWRLARAERQARRMFALGLIGGAGVVMLIAAAPAARRSSGSTVRAPFTVLDGQGKPAMTVDAGSLGRYLTLYDKAGHKIVVVSALAQSGGSVLLSDEKDNISAHLYAGSKGGELETVSRGTKMVVAALGCGQSMGNAQGGVLHLESAAGTRHPDGVMLYVGPSGGTLDVFNKAGKLVFKAP